MEESEEGESGEGRSDEGELVSWSASGSEGDGDSDGLGVVVWEIEEEEEVGEGVVESLVAPSGKRLRRRRVRDWRWGLGSG